MTKADMPIKIGSKTVKNRVTFAPTVKFGWSDESGIAHRAVLRATMRTGAKGGTGLICVEATCVNPLGRLAPSQLGLWDDSQIEGTPRDHRCLPQARRRCIGSDPSRRLQYTSRMRSVERPFCGSVGRTHHTGDDARRNRRDPRAVY